MLHVVLVKELINQFKPVQQSKLKLTFLIGLNRTGHMSFLTGQDRTPKFVGQVLPDRTKSGLTFLNILHTNYGDFEDYY